jgi:hypothetical protein
LDLQFEYPPLNRWRREGEKGGRGGKEKGGRIRETDEMREGS